MTRGAAGLELLKEVEVVLMRVLCCCWLGPSPLDEDVASSACTACLRLIPFIRRLPRESPIGHSRSLSGSDIMPS